MATRIVPVYAEALERAASRDREVIAETIRKMDLQNIMAARYFAKRACAFDATGRLVEKYYGVMIIQWQDGKCIPVYPAEVAAAPPRFVS